MHISTFSRFSSATLSTIFFSFIGFFTTFSYANVEEKVDPAVTLSAMTALQNLNTQQVTHLTYAPDESRIIYLKAQLNKPTVFDLWQYHIGTDTNNLLIASGAQSDDAINIDNISDIAFISKGRAIAFMAAGDIYSYTLATKAIKAYTNTAEKESQLTISPSSEKISFIRQNNIFYIDVNSGNETQLTRTTDAISKNGVGNFVSKQFLKRSNSFWWSPNDEHIAFIQTNNWKTNKELTQATLSTSLMLLDVKKGKTKALATPRSQRYIVDVQWLSNSEQLAYVWLTKNQQQLGLNFYNEKNNKQSNVITEKSLFWLSPEQELAFINNNKSFIWSSARDGYKHLYHYNLKGEKIAQLTQGDWSVNALTAVDETSGQLYFTGRADSALEQHLYKVPLTTTSPESVSRISQQAGFHQVTFSPTNSQYISRYSNAETPEQLRLHALNGNPLGWLDANNRKDHALIAPHFQKRPSTQVGSLTASDNKTSLFYKVSTPANMTTGKKYPAIVLLPSSPLAQRITNTWQNTSLSTYLTNQGFVVFELDARGSSNRGTAFQFPLFQDIGSHEVLDQLAGINYLSKLAFVDKNNIALHGENYGGYLALRLLKNQYELENQARPENQVSSENQASLVNQSMPKNKHSDSDETAFISKASIGGSVYNWAEHYYFLTEKWLPNLTNATQNTANSNTDNSNTASLYTIDIKALNQPLFIYHAMEDTHVDISQFYALTHDLQQAGTRFDMMLYPKANHNFTDASLKAHLYKQLAEFLTP